MSSPGAGPRFDRNRLALARRWRGLRKLDLAEAAKVSPAAITQYEQGRTRPSPAVAAAMALRLGLPVEFFAPGRPSAVHDVSGAHFRSLRATSQATRQQALAWAELTWEVLRAIELDVRLPKVVIPELSAPAIGDREGIEELAQEVRVIFAVPVGPLPNVVRLLETKGAMVTRLTGIVQQVDAFSHRFADRPMVLLNPAKQDAARARLDAAHELGHLVMHHDADPGGRDIERQAQAFAASFLTPAQEIAPELPTRADWERLIQLKQRWGISIAALLYRARELGVMRDVTYRNAMMTISSRGWRLQEPGDLGDLERPNLFGQACARLVDRGVTSLVIATRTGLPVALTEHILAEAAADPLPAGFTAD